MDSLYPPGQAKVKALTRKQITNESMRLYNEVSVKSQCGFIAFTSNLWSSPSLKSFIGLSLHANDEKFHFHTFVPFIKLFVGAHTGVNIQVMSSSRKVHVKKLDNLCKRQQQLYLSFVNEDGDNFEVQVKLPNELCEK